MVTKAGDSMTVRYTSTSAGSVPYSVRWDFASGSYKGSAATVGTVTVTGGSVTSVGYTAVYLDPVTGAALGTDPATAGASDTVTTYEPADWESQLTKAGIEGGSSGKIAVTATVKGKSVSDGFAPLGGATAIVIKYEFVVNRDANETVATAAKSFSNACKFRVNFQVKDFQVVGPAASSPLLSALLPTLQTSFTYPTNVTLWTTSAMPWQLPKTISVVTLPAPTGAITTTGELTSLTLAPR
jgi:hypothetical protein